GHGFEVNHCLDTNTTDLFHIANAGNTNHDCRKNNGCHHHPDESDEAVTEKLTLLSELRSEISEHGTDRNGDQYLNIKTLSQVSFGHARWLFVLLWLSWLLWEIPVDFGLAVCVHGTVDC